MKSPRLDGLLGYQLRRAQLRAFTAFADVTGDIALSPLLFGVLAMIAVHPGAGQREIAEALVADPSTIVRLVDTLETRGLLRRVTHPVDRRTVVPTLTAEGEALLERATPLVRASEDAFAAELSEDERAQLAELLRRLNAPR